MIISQPVGAGCLSKHEWVLGDITTKDCQILELELLVKASKDTDSDMCILLSYDSMLSRASTYLLDHVIRKLVRAKLFG